MDLVLLKILKEIIKKDTSSLHSLLSIEILKSKPIAYDIYNILDKQIKAINDLYFMNIK